MNSLCVMKPVGRDAKEASCQVGRSHESKTADSRSFVLEIMCERRRT